MGEILGVGITHYPPMLGMPETYANILRITLGSPNIPEQSKDPANWPQEMRAQYENELECAHEHQRRHRDAFARVRAEIDDFQPDAVLIFGDDQYENFKEDVIPPFNVFCCDEFPAQPFHNPENIWDVPAEHEVCWPGAGQLAREITTGIIERNFPIAYSYKNLHYERGLSHAFANGLVFLDWEQRGWPWPIIPIMVNCYGKDVISSRGGLAHIFDTKTDAERDPYLDTLGPSGPTPRSCFELGQVVRRVLEERPERFVVMASSGWSHAFLTGKHDWLYPDREFDRARHAELAEAKQKCWAELSNQQIEEAGDHEFKNWICLAGVVEDRHPEIIDYLDTWIFNSQKCFAIFEP